MIQWQRLVQISNEYQQKHQQEYVYVDSSTRSNDPESFDTNDIIHKIIEASALTTEERVALLSIPDEPNATVRRIMEEVSALTTEERVALLSVPDRSGSTDLRISLFPAQPTGQRPDLGDDSSSAEDTSAEDTEAIIEALRSGPCPAHLALDSIDNGGSVGVYPAPVPPVHTTTESRTNNAESSTAAASRPGRG